ncbi:hypothetical protein IV203_005574 [Nitzschia inconspicua]|uniref:Uncharacterized protein n=1 Tax=Nitzschia inconspicua TaxID=303405 RepID=A0A9K3KNC9_9STRA|nr:hypothetical protein IV203_005574 [Nitzschia inconspicua]
MGPSSAMDFIGFAKGRQETLDITDLLKETMFSFKPTEEEEHHSTREGKQRRRRSLHNTQDKPFGDAEFGFSRRRGSLGQVSSIEYKTPIHPLEGTGGDAWLSRRRNSMGHESRSLDNKNQQQVDSNRQLLTSDLSPRVERRDVHDRSRPMEHSTESKKHRSKSGRKSCPPEKRKSLDALSNGRRSGAGSSGRITDRSQNSRNSSITPEVSQSLRNTSLGTYKGRSQSARDLKLSPTTMEPSRSDRNLKLSQSPEGSSGSSSRSGGYRKDRSRSSRRPKKNPNMDSGSSSKNYSRASKAPIRQSKSLRSLSVSGNLVDSEMVTSKTSSKPSSSPKSSKKDLPESKQSSSRSLKEMKPASSRSLQSKVQGSSAGSSRRHLTKSSPIRQSRSSTKLATSPKVTTTASLRQEMKEVLKNFPDLQNSSSSPIHSPESSRSPLLDNSVTQGPKAENDYQPTSFTGPSSPVQKGRSSKISHRRLSLQFDCRLDNLSGSSGRQKSLRDLNYDGDNLPEVVDDTLQRENLDGKKGDKSWNICEDTPGGHAPERLTSVCVEYYADSMDEDEDILDEDDEDAAEDDTVLQDSVSLPRPNRKQILPRDPAQKGQKISAARSARPADRFNPSFQNRDMWKSDEFNSSADLSIITFRTKEEIDSASELETAMTDYTLTNHTFETYMLEQDCNHQNDKETPSTLKRTGGRRVEEGGSTSFPGLQADCKYEKGDDDDDDVFGDRDRRPFSVPEDDVLDSFDPEAVGIRRKIKSKSSKEQQHPGSNSTGRSSPRKSSRSHSKKRRSGKRSGVPTSVPSSPYESSYSLRSPLSSSFTSPQTSSTMNSSSRQNPEFVNLRRQIDHARNNKTLQNYVGRGHSSPQNDDENTLGASTITTNFSTTQRTFGDNTVSTRSLFQSDVMKGSDMMKIPQRQRYDSDAELEDDEHQVQDTINSTFDLLQSNDTIGQIASILSSEQKFSPATPSKVLRRPSRESDDFFDELEEMRVSSDQSDLDSNPKSSSRDLSSREIKSSPEDELRRSSSEAAQINPNIALNLSPRAAFKKKSKRSMFKRIQS